MADGGLATELEVDLATFEPMHYASVAISTRTIPKAMTGLKSSIVSVKQKISEEVSKHKSILLSNTTQLVDLESQLAAIFSSVSDLKEHSRRAQRDISNPLDSYAGKRPWCCRCRCTNSEPTNLM